MRAIFLLTILVFMLCAGSPYISSAAEITENPRYREINTALAHKGMCMACASNIAEAYVKYPDSDLARTVDRAMSGNSGALDALQRLNATVPLPSQKEGPGSGFIRFLSVALVLLVYLGVIVFLSLAIFSRRFRQRLKAWKRFMVTNQNARTMSALAVAIPFGLILFTDNRTPEEIACSDDWRRCRDNPQLIDTGSYHARMAAACERAASKKAKYGVPEFPRFSFSNYQPGREYVKTGMVYLVERNALFQNVFGTKVHTEATCKYDLNRDQVEDVIIWN